MTSDDSLLMMTFREPAVEVCMVQDRLSLVQALNFYN